jgi:hypothetical protein
MKKVLSAVATVVAAFAPVIIFIIILFGLIFLSVEGRYSATAANISLLITDGINSFSSVQKIIFHNAVASGSNSGKTVTVNPIISDTTKTASYPVVANDMGGALNLAGTSGTPALTLSVASSTVFAPGMTLAVAVTGTVPWTITNSTGLTLNGLAVTTLLPGDSGTFVANSDGTHLDYFAGARQTITSPLYVNEAHGTLDTVTLTSNNYTAVVGDCGHTKLLPTGTTPTVTLPNLNLAAGVDCTITFRTSVAISYKFQGTGSGVVENSQGFFNTRGTAADDVVSVQLKTPSSTAAHWGVGGDVTL